jgi:hypothetical protein
MSSCTGKLLLSENLYLIKAKNAFWSEEPLPSGDERSGSAFLSRMDSIIKGEISNV